MRSRRALLVAALALVVGACRETAPGGVVALSPDWHNLQREPTPFAALYRLSCCGQRNMPTTIRGDGRRLQVAVAVPPGGIAAEVWLTRTGGVLLDRRERCRVALPPGIFPLRGGAELPLSPRLAAFVLSGWLAPDSVPSLQRPGWVGEIVDGEPVEALPGGAPLHVQEVKVLSPGGAGVRLSVRLDTAGGRLPHRIELLAGAERASLDLVEWMPTSKQLEEPSWVRESAPCPAAGDGRP